MNKVLAFIGFLALAAPIAGQSTPSPTAKKLIWGFSGAAGLQREIHGNSDYSTPDRSVAYSYDLHWGWRAQAGIIGDYHLGKSPFGIRWGLALGLQQVNNDWICTISDPNVPSTEPYRIRYESEELQALVDAKASLRYCSKGEQPWIAQLGSFLSRYGGISGRTTLFATGAIDYLQDGLSSGIAIGIFAQGSTQFPCKWGVFEPTVEARLQMAQGRNDPKLSQFAAMAGVNFWIFGR